MGTTSHQANRPDRHLLRLHSITNNPYLRGRHLEPGEELSQASPLCPLKHLEEHIPQCALRNEETEAQRELSTQSLHAGEPQNWYLNPRPKCATVYSIQQHSTLCS